MVWASRKAPMGFMEASSSTFSQNDTITHHFKTKEFLMSIDIHQYLDDYETYEEKISLLEDLANRHFPIRDENDSPMFRPHQKEAIVKILEAFFIKNKKFALVDGPVGCGKSAINYTVGRIIDQTVYITPFKMLQDQVINEKWESMRMMKGKGSYACNYCGLDTTMYKCNYDGGDVDTCNTNSSQVLYSKDSYDKMADFIDTVVEMGHYNKNIRTSFNDGQDFIDSVPFIEDFIDETIEMVGDVDYEKRNQYIKKNLMCSLDDGIECPAKTSKIMSRIASISVLNPDVFYYLNLNKKSFFRRNNLLIYDESQQIESVISRIFGSVLNISDISKRFGLNLKYLSEIYNKKELMNEVINVTREKILPYCIAIKILNSLGDYTKVRNTQTLEKCMSNNHYSNMLFRCLSNYFVFRKDNSEFSLVKICIYAFEGKDLPEEYSSLKDFYESLKSLFFEECLKKDFEPKDFKISEFIKNIEQINHELISDKTKSNSFKASKSDIARNLNDDSLKISKDYYLVDILDEFKLNTYEFAKKVMSLSTVIDDESMIFTIGFNDKKVKNYNKFETHKLMNLVPINVAKLMNSFYYSRAEKVLLTSGTWVSPDSTFKTFGIPKEDSEFIKIPSMFDKNKRKIFIANKNTITDFSQKVAGSEMDYVYKTKEGTIKFTLELYNFITRIRKYIRNNHNENANIIVHCHTFDIARRIAQYIPHVNDSYLIHLPEYIGEVINLRNKYVSYPIDKLKLIQEVMNRPNQGLTIISPSVSEGVDFKNQIARAQIILKNPIPYLGDPYISAHSRGDKDIGIEKDPEFITRNYYTTLTQQYGRIMRSSDDWGYTIIHDQSLASSIKRIIRNNKKIDKMNLNYFFDGIQTTGSGKGITFDWVFG